MLDFTPIKQLLSAAITEQHFPGAVYLISEEGETKAFEALGNAVVTPEIIPVNTDTIYDLASLTKPLVTGLLCVEIESPAEVLNHIAGIGLENKPGTNVVYSDLGYITLGKMIERITESN